MQKSEENYEGMLDSSMHKPRLVAGIDPGKRMSGLVVACLDPVFGIQLAKRTKNPVVCDFLWRENFVLVCMEDFRIYPWALKSMRWDELNEVRMIGAVEEICRFAEIPLSHYQPSVTKSISDKQLVALGTWSRNAHVNDAFRVLWCGVLRENLRRTNGRR